MWVSNTKAMGRFLDVVYYDFINVTRAMEPGGFLCLFVFAYVTSYWVCWAKTSGVVRNSTILYFRPPLGYTGNSDP